VRRPFIIQCRAIRVNDANEIKAKLMFCLYLIGTVVKGTYYIIYQNIFSRMRNDRALITILILPDGFIEALFDYIHMGIDRIMKVGEKICAIKCDDDERA
jgi:hypothetical protein